MANMGKKVIKYDKDGFLLEEYKTISRAVSVNDLSHDGLIQAARFGKEYHGFIWSVEGYTDDKSLNPPHEDYIEALNERKKELEKELDLIDKILKKHN